MAGDALKENGGEQELGARARVCLVDRLHDGRLVLLAVPDHEIEDVDHVLLENLKVF